MAGKLSIDQSSGQPMSDGPTTQQRGALHDQSNWMGALDESLLTVPLNQLSIPGSHDSFTHYLDRDGPVGPDGPSGIASLVQVFGAPAKSIIYNWSVTQSLSPLQQLRAGIRYFDIRLAAGSSTNHSTDNLRVVHGLYGSNIWDCLGEVESFIVDHPNEVILLDFKAFYNMNPELHKSFLDRLTDRFESLMCPVCDLSELTLHNLRKHNHRLIVFYHNPAPASSSRFNRFWPGCFIESPWPNVTKVEALLGRLDEQWKDGRDGRKFQVTQGVLTTDAGCIIAGLRRSLKSCFAEPLAPRFVEWVTGRESKIEEMLGEVGASSDEKKSSEDQKTSHLLPTAAECQVKGSGSAHKDVSKDERNSADMEADGIKDTGMKATGACDGNVSAMMEGLQCCDGVVGKEERQEQGRRIQLESATDGCEGSSVEPILVGNNSSSGGKELNTEVPRLSPINQSRSNNSGIPVVSLVKGAVTAEVGNRNVVAEGARLWKTNICIIDFIELADYSGTIVNLNARRVARLKK